MVDDASGKRVPVNVAESSVIGATNESAASTDTSTSGINGLFKRLLQRITVLIGQLPTSLGSQGALKIEGVASGTNVNVAIVSGGGSGGTASSFGAAFPATGTAIGAKDSAGTNMAALNLDASGNLKVVSSSTAGDVAHDSADSGNPVKIGAKAIALGTNPTGVTANDRTNLYANRAGVLFVQGGHPNTLTLKTAITSTQTDAAIVTQGAGGKIVVTAVEASLSNTSNQDLSWTLGFGTASTPSTTGVVAGHSGMFAGQQYVKGNGAGTIGIGADNEDLRITTGSITGSVTFWLIVTYYTIES